MYRVLLADDEQIVLRGLMKSIHWEQLDCQVAACSASGEEAFRLAMELKPDIVITDIKMPGKTGLELIRELKEAGLNAAFLVFSGYNEFDFAKEALRLETVDYLLKPMNIEEIEQAIQRAKLRVRENNARTLVRENRDILLERSLNRLLDGEIESLESLNGFSAFAVVCLQTLTAEPELPLRELEEQFAHLEGSGRRLFKVRQKRMLSLICATERHHEIYDFVRKLLSVLQHDQLVMDRAFFWGIGEICQTQRELSSSFGTACESLQYSVFTQEQTGKAPRFLTDASDSYDQMIDQLAQGLFRGEEEFHLQEQLEQLFERMLYEQLSVDAMHSVCCNLVYNCRYLAGHNYAHILKHSFSDALSVSRVMQFETIEELKKDLLQTFRQIRRALANDGPPVKSAVIRRIYTYVENHMDQPITLTDLAGYVNMNASYISHIFKKETGANLFDFIVEHKMEQAMKLLENDTLLIGEVARRVGYEDQRYFCQVFKKRTGMTAMEYRNQPKKTHPEAK